MVNIYITVNIRYEKVTHFIIISYFLPVSFCFLISSAFSSLGNLHIMQRKRKSHCRDWT